MCRNETEVLNKVFQLLGTPSNTHCSSYLSLPKWKKGTYLEITPPGCLRTCFPDAPPQAIDLLSKMLALDPTKRILAKEALSHPYFT
jgi:serine/threonine protein kinase